MYMEKISVCQFNEEFPVGFSFIWQRSRFLRGGLAVESIAPAIEVDGVVMVQINDWQQSVVPVEHLVPVGAAKKQQINNCG